MRPSLNALFWLLALSMTALVASACKSGSGGGSDDPDGDTETPVIEEDGDDTSEDGDEPGEDGDDEEPVPCENVSACQEGEICAGGFCGPCAVEAQCLADYGVGATCDDGVCHAALCPDGSLGCPCDEGSCNEGECVQGTCTDCERGSLGCVCMNNGTCEAGARCGEDNLCVVCPAGEQGCPCEANDICDDPLVCDAGLCIVDPCPVGTQGCRCGEDDACGEGLYCTASDLCAACSNDVEGCPCDENDTCENDLVCDGESDTCREAIRCADLEPACMDHQVCAEPVGVDAHCLEECEQGWAWNAQTHACDELPPAPNCTPDAEGSILATCDGQNRVCVAEAQDAHCGACKPYFLDDSGTLPTCRAVTECTGLDCQAQNRTCIEHGPTTDAVCGDCLGGYVEDQGGCYLPNCEPDAPGSLVAACQAENRTCVNPPESSAACGDCLDGYATNEQQACQRITRCAADDLNCAGKLRTCEGVHPFQSCGDCVAGAYPDPSDAEACRTPITCAELDCEADEICLEGAEDEDAYCEDSLCGPGQAWTEYGTPRCVTCYVNCEGGEERGYTGRIWPFTLQGSTECLCETRQGYYWDNGSRKPEYCDRDGDGWVRNTARTYITSTDDALRENANCTLRTIDRFTLQNEYGQRLDVRLCDDPTLPFVRQGDEASCTAFATLALYESQRNDDQVELEASSITDTPTYTLSDDGTTIGRRLQAGEINGLTKACVSTAADYNHNNIGDISEWHGMTSGSLEGDAKRFAAFSYYLELHRGWYEGVTGLVGRYVIAERSRCDQDFPIGYGEEPSDYWRECTRNRDINYHGNGDPNYPNYGLDFAGWSCDVENGSCPVAPPPTNNPPNIGLTPAHGLCNAAPLPADPECDAAGPWYCIENPDGGYSVWRGMSHHSQFRCVVVNNETSNAEPRIAQADVVLSGGYRFNDCGVACPPGDELCASDCATAGGCVDSSESPSVGTLNPHSPRVACSVGTNPSLGSVGFVAARYPHYDGTGNYERGCINEWIPKKLAGSDPYGENSAEVRAWRSLCPGWADNPHDVIGQGDGNNFGELQCGCGNNYGGYSCEVGCPDEQLLLSQGYSVTPRGGYWMCGDVALTGYTDMDMIEGPALVGGSFVLRGEIPVSTIGGDALCQDEGCTTGFTIR